MLTVIPLLGGNVSSALVCLLTTRTGNKPPWNRRLPQNRSVHPSSLDGKERKYGYTDQLQRHGFQEEILRRGTVIQVPINKACSPTAPSGDWRVYYTQGNEGRQNTLPPCAPVGRSFNKVRCSRNSSHTSCGCVLRPGI